jgi:Fe-S-cluster containining protein
MKKKERCENPKKEKPSVKYRRVGRCNPKKCGAFCCRCGPFMTLGPYYDRSENKLLKMFNYKIEKIGKKKIARSIQVCNNLNGIRCDIYKKRPDACKDFPEDRNMEWFRIAKNHGCTYRFKRVKKCA